MTGNESTFQSFAIYAHKLDGLARISRGQVRPKFVGERKRDARNERGKSVR